ncbi:MAG: hypothetical protein R6V42_06425 [Orrella sp.]
MPVAQTRAKPRAAQRGQALLEWLVVATLVLLAVIWGSDKWMARAEQAALEGLGHWMLTLSEAMQKAVETQTTKGEPIADLLAQDPPASVEDWQQRLQQTGFLFSGFASKPPLAFRMLIHRITTDGDCQNSVCPTALLLLALPPEDWQASRRANAGADLLLALKGRGLAVTTLSPQRLQGGAFGVDSQWPLGTVGLVVWRSDVLPPYVRLQEDRPVHLSGGLEVDGQLSVRGQLAVSQGLLLGEGAKIDTACAPEGLLLRSSDQQLFICRQARWQLPTVQQRQSQTARRLTGRSCLPPPPEHILMPYWRESGLLKPILRPPASAPCRCPDSYLPRLVGQMTGSVAGIPITKGYICEKS